MLLLLESGSDGLAILAVAGEQLIQEGLRPRPLGAVIHAPLRSELNQPLADLLPGERHWIATRGASAHRSGRRKTSAASVREAAPFSARLAGESAVRRQRQASRLPRRAGRSPPRQHVQNRDLLSIPARPAALRSRRDRPMSR
jgi:hypothetical protein